MAATTKKTTTEKTKAEYAYWIVYAGEELPLAISIAKTRQGAIKRFQEKTGNLDEGIHVEKIVFKDRCFLFSTAI